MSILPGPRRPATGRSLARDWNQLENQMQRLLGRSPLWEGDGEPFLLSPQVDFTESNGEFVLTAELPGIEPEDVHIDLEGNVLTLKGEKREVREKEDEKVRLSERRYGTFERSFTLPLTADPESVSADFEKGILRIHIGKRPETRGRKIEIKPGE